MENHAFDVKSGVDIDNISCNCSCIVAGQQKGRASKLLGINRSPEWRPSLCLVQKFIEMLDPGCRACPDGTGGQSIDADSFMPKFVGERSEEHTSELQSLMRISYAVFCLKKKKATSNTSITLKY